MDSDQKPGYEYLELKTLISFSLLENRFSVFPDSVLLGALLTNTIYTSFGCTTDDSDLYLNDINLVCNRRIQTIFKMGCSYGF